MLVGVVTEIKAAERRVSLTPAGARLLVADGHEVLVQAGAGEGAGFADSDYAQVGSIIVRPAAEVWREADLLLKVKEPVEAEYDLLRADGILFTYLHLAADTRLVDALIESGTCAIAYETVEDQVGRLPLLAPMSEVAGRLAAQAGAHYLQAPFGGPGTLIGGVSGVAPAHVVVLGGGVVGTEAARVAHGMGAQVTILERSLSRIRQLHVELPGVQVLVSDESTLEELLPSCDLLIGAVLIPGAEAPKLVRREHLRTMRPGAVAVDVAVDQGGCLETTRPTTHLEPTFVEEGVLHYCVANMPGAVPRTSTRALTNATFPYVRAIAGLGLEQAIQADPGLRAGLNVVDGRIVQESVREALGRVRALA